MDTPIKSMTPAEAQTLICNTAVLVLDCRDLNDYRHAHIDGALHAHDGLVENLIRKGDKAQNILIYCYSGHRSGHLTEFLTGFGFTNAVNLSGGYNSWQEAAAADA